MYIFFREPCGLFIDVLVWLCFKDVRFWSAANPASVLCIFHSKIQNLSITKESHYSNKCCNSDVWALGLDGVRQSSQWWSQTERSVMVWKAWLKVIVAIALKTCSVFSSKRHDFVGLVKLYVDILFNKTEFWWTCMLIFDWTGQDSGFGLSCMLVSKSIGQSCGAGWLFW